jgi:hypothetical protein
LIPKGGFQIAQRDLKPGSIKEAKERTCGPGKMIADPSRTQWDEFCGKEKPQPFKPVAKPFPSRRHCSFE